MLNTMIGQNAPAGKPGLNGKPILFVTLFEHDAARLRAIGLDARRRPEAGIFTKEHLKEFKKRDVAILQLSPFRNDDWPQRAIAEIAKTAKKCGIFTPEACLDRTLSEPTLDDVFRSYDEFGYDHAETFELEAQIYLEDAARHRPAEPDGPRKRASIMNASTIKPLPIEWLWENRIPLGCLTTFSGDPKLGKSFVSLDLAAAVSRGRPMPGETERHDPGSVVILSSEDDPARTIVPRLISSHANLEKIHILDSIILADGNEAFPSLRADIDAIMKGVEEIGDVKLIIIDPISAYLGGTDDHRNAELRSVLSPLAQAAERLDIAIVLITHLNKSNGTNGKHRVTGSIATVAASRANFLFAQDKNDPTHRQCFMIPNGCNLAPECATLAYSIVDRGDGPAVEWSDAPIEITAEQALATEPVDDDRSTHDEIDVWLKGELSSGSRPATEILALGRKMYFSDKAIRASKARLLITHNRCGFGKDSIVTWSLPNPEETF